MNNVTNQYNEIELSSQEMKILLIKNNLTQRKLSRIFRRRHEQVWQAINTTRQKGLRKRITKYLLNREEKRVEKSQRTQTQNNDAGAIRQ